MEEQKELSLEENFEKIEAILDTLSEENVSLEEAFRKYSEGMELLKKCNDQIDLVEKKVMLLNDNGELTDFT